MPLSHEHVGSKILAEIKIYILTRAELLCPLCYEIPCIENQEWLPVTATNRGDFSPIL